MAWCSKKTTQTTCVNSHLWDMASPDPNWQLMQF